MNYIHYISSPLVNGSHYGNRGFASPMKELNDQTVLVENSENKNDSYRQRTKYDDRVDSYFSTYDLGILLQNRDSYLEGKLDSNGDVDCYSFSYAQKSSTCAVRFYSHTTKLGTQIQWICSFLGHYKRNLSLSEPDILIVILIDHFDSSKGTASML